MKATHLHTPLDIKTTRQLKAGDPVLLSGAVYSARDAAHIRFQRLLDHGLPLPFDLCDAVIYYTGPCPAPPGYTIGTAGPTTAGRMDSFAPALHQAGLAASIGKGKRSKEVRQTLQDYGRVYFGAVGGAGVLLARHINTCEVIAYPELGPEAVLRLVLDEFPLFVAYDSYGDSVYF